MLSFPKMGKTEIAKQQGEEYPNQIGGRECLKLIDEIARKVLHGISYELGDYNQFPTISIEEGLEKAKQWYQKTISTPEWCETDYWVKRLEGSIYRAIYATFLAMSKDENIKMEKIQVDRAYPGSAVTTIDLLVDWSDTVFKKLGHEMSDFYHEDFI